MNGKPADCDVGPEVFTACDREDGWWLKGNLTRKGSCIQSKHTLALRAPVAAEGLGIILVSFFRSGVCGPAFPYTSNSSPNFRNCPVCSFSLNGVAMIHSCLRLTAWRPCQWLQVSMTAKECTFSDSINVENSLAEGV